MERLDGCGSGDWPIRLSATGFGAYIREGDRGRRFPTRVVLGIAVMCVLVRLFNCVLWRPLYAFGERWLRLG